MGLFVDPIPVSAPAGSAPGTGWALVDYLTLTLSTVADAGGVATVACPSVQGGQLWKVGRAVVSCSGTGPAQPVCNLYVDEVSQRGLRDNTAVGLLDVSEYPNYLYVREASALIAQWTGAPAGSSCCLHIDYEVWTRV